MSIHLLRHPSETWILLSRLLKWILFSIGIMIALYVVTLIMLEKNDWVSYKADRLTLFNRLGVPEPKYQSVSRISSSGAGEAVYVYRGVSAWKDNDEPDWKYCKLSDRGRSFVSTVQNVVSGEVWERSFPDKGIVTIFRTKQNSTVVILIGEFMDIGGDLPNPDAKWRVCVPDATPRGR